MRPSLKTKITTPKFAETCAWYERLFGMIVAEAWDEQGDRGAILVFPGGQGEALLEIYHGETPADFTGLSLQFRVDDLEEFRRALPADVPYGGPNKRPWGSTYLYLRDPNDIAIVVFEGGY